MEGEMEMREIEEERERERGQEMLATCIEWTAPSLPISPHPPLPTHTPMSGPFPAPGVGCTCNHGGSLTP